jgi:ribosomal protein S27AE
MASLCPNPSSGMPDVMADPSDPNRFMCGGCRDTTFQTKGGAKIHWLHSCTANLNLWKYLCTECGRRFKWQMHLDRHKLNKCPVLLEQQQNAVVKKKVAVPGQAVLKCKVPTEAAKRYATERLANQELALSRYAALDTQVQQRSVHHQPTQRRPAQYLPSQNLPVPEQSAWPHLSPMSLMADYTRRQIYAQGAVMVPVSQPTTIDPRLIFRETTNDSFTPSQFSSHHAVPVQGAWTLPLDSDGTGNSSSVSTFGHHGPPNTGFWTRTPSLGDADNPISLGISPVAGSELSVDPPMPDLSSRTRRLYQELALRIPLLSNHLAAELPRTLHPEIRADFRIMTRQLLSKSKFTSLQVLRTSSMAMSQQTPCLKLITDMVSGLMTRGIQDHNRNK